MAARFGSFVLFAEMRTGSNHLEETLNGVPGLVCHGEAFNPHFVGHEGQEALLGIGRAARDRDPLRLLRRMRAEPGLSGFRFFHDHDARVLEAVVADPSCAKVVLTRDPAEAWVSLQIAERTGRWRITDVAHRETPRVRFDPMAFAAWRARVEGFRDALLRRLRDSGQVPFVLDHGEINDAAVLTGLVRFLGVEAETVRPSTRLKRQNPGPLRDKVTNPEAMEAALGRVPGEAGPPLAGIAALEAPPLLFLPLAGTGEQRVTAAMAARGPVRTGFDGESLRPWLNRTKDRTAFTVIAHPVARAWRLCAAARGWVPDRAGFLDHLAARRESGLPPAEAPQAEILARLAAEILPDRVLREEGLDAGLAALGLEPVAAEDGLAGLDGAPDAEVETAVRGLYNRDYRQFGFRRWGA